MRRGLPVLVAAAFATSSHAQQQTLDLDRPPTEFDPSMFDLEPWAPDYEPPRTAQGHPSFEGTWTNVSITTWEGVEGAQSLVVTPEEAWRLIQLRTEGWSEDEAATDPDAPALAAGNGEIRTSWLVEPVDGPRYTDEARAILAERYANYTNFSDPETRAVGERCVAGFGGTGGPPMLNVLYNNTYEFAQSEDTIAIVVEMVHQPRLIRMNAEHRSAELRPWLGDSVGRWEGDTLVVHTVNHHPDMTVRGRELIVAPDTEVEERFTRVADDTIFYEVTVTDPDIYEVPHRGEMVFKATDKPQYEYACHEGNYSLSGILAGARRDEQSAADGSASARGD